MFLEKTELRTVVDINLVDKITNLDDTIVEEIIKESIGLMVSYLRPQYDTDTIFSATGTDRHPTVKKYLKDIVIYEIYIRHTREMNEVALQRYENSMRWLENLNTGKFATDLPQAIDSTPEDTTGITITFGSNTRYTSNF